MKILIVTDAWHPQINGVVRTLQNTVDYLESKGNHVKVIHSGKCLTIPVPGYDEIEVALNPWITLRETRKFNPDSIHIATEGPIGLFYRNWCEAKSYKYTTSYHTKFPEYAKIHYCTPLRVSYQYMRWFHSKSKNVLITTESLKSELQSRGFRNNLVVWKRGVSNEFKPLPRKERDLPIFLYVGRLSKEKGIEDFLNIKYKCEKVVVGDGPQRRELSKQYPDVRFTGYLKGQDLVYEYSNADVFVFPSRTDAFGNVVQEAIATGTPVAAYNVTGPKDIIEEGVSGYYSSNDLLVNCLRCLSLDRNAVADCSKNMSTDAASQLFYDSLVSK